MSETVLNPRDIRERMKRHQARLDVIREKEEEVFFLKQTHHQETFKDFGIVDHECKIENAAKLAKRVLDNNAK